MSGKKEKAKTDRRARIESTPRINPDKLLGELFKRGISSAKFAAHAHIDPQTMSGIMHGDSFSPATFRKIVSALESLPVLSGADLLVAS